MLSMEDLVFGRYEIDYDALNSIFEMDRPVKDLGDDRVIIKTIIKYYNDYLLDEKSWNSTNEVDYIKDKINKLGPVEND